MAFAESRSPTAAEIGRRHAHFRSIGLSRVDHDALVAALAGIKEYLDDIGRSRQAMAGKKTMTESDLRSAFDEIKAREYRVIQTTRERLLATLTKDGFARLTNHINVRIKPRIVVYEAKQ